MELHAIAKIAIHVTTLGVNQSSIPPPNGLIVDAFPYSTPLVVHQQPLSQQPPSQQPQLLTFASMTLLVKTTFQSKVLVRIRSLVPLD
jgi:hypothetical protein